MISHTASLTFILCLLFGSRQRCSSRNNSTISSGTIIKLRCAQEARALGRKAAGLKTLNSCEEVYIMRNDLVKAVCPIKSIVHQQPSGSKVSWTVPIDAYARRSSGLVTAACADSIPPPTRSHYGHGPAVLCPHVPDQRTGSVESHRHYYRELNKPISIQSRTCMLMYGTAPILENWC